MDAEILLIGDEILAGEVRDRNGPAMRDVLAAEGIRTVGIAMLPDERAAIAGAVARGLAAGRLVCVLGGLGPTADDLTAEAIAGVVDRPLVRDEAQWLRVQQIFAAMNRTPPPGNDKQVHIPAGADVLANEAGTAPGWALALDSGLVAVFPGPPRENGPMMTGPFVAWLAAHLPDRTRWQTRVFRTFGLPESEVGHRLKPLEARLGPILLAYQYHFPEVLVKLRVPAGSEPLADTLTNELRTALAPALYGEGDDDLPAVLGRQLKIAGRRIVTAESCTGGLAGKLLTDTPGSTAWYERGFITYTNEAKVEVLRVPRDLLRAHGAVSEEVAAAMLQGALERSAADVGLAITGIAGPGGGSPDKPVGTVCLAWGDREGSETHTLHLRWDRDYNRIVSAWSAMARVLRLLTE
jgi:nicotinamide-nucleotide amidase